MSRILWMSDGPRLNTGFSSQSLGICNALAEDRHEVHFLDHTAGGQPCKPGIRLFDDTEFKFYLHGNGMQPYCSDIIEHRLRELKVDIFGVLLDTFMLYQAGYMNKDFSPTKAQIIYYPSDGGMNLPANCENILKKFSHPVAMSRFAQQQAKEIHGINSLYIPHFVDSNLFRPISQEEKEILKRKWGFQGKYIIFSNFRNQGRKFSDRQIKAFAKAKDKMPNAIMLCNCDPYDPAGYYDMFGLINKLGLGNRVFFTGMKYFKGLTYKELAQVYNLADIMFQSTSGEGFGITTIEAMACEVPVLLTSYTTTHELIEHNKAGEGIKLSGTEQMDPFQTGFRNFDTQAQNGTILGSWMVERGVMSIEDAAQKLIKLYNDENLRKEYGKNGRRAVLREYSYEIVGDQWKQLIRKL